MTSYYDPNEDQPIRPRNDYTITLFGKHGVGKTTIVNQTLYPRKKIVEKSTSSARETFVNFLIKKVECRVCIRDTGDIDENKLKWDEWIKSSQCFIFVFSWHDEASFECFAELYDTILKIKKNEPFGFLVIGNKSDLEKFQPGDFDQRVTAVGLKAISHSFLKAYEVEEKKPSVGNCIDELLHKKVGDEQATFNYFNTVLFDYLQKIEKTSVMDMSVLTDSFNLLMMLGAFK